MRYLRFISLFLFFLFALGLTGVGLAQGDEPIPGLTGVGQARGDFQPQPFGPNLIWTVNTIDSAGDVGSYADLAINPVTGMPQISYFDSTTGDLSRAYSTNNPINFPCLITGWECEKYSTNDNDGSFTAMDIKSNGNYGILYLNNTQDKINFRGDQGNGQIVPIKEIEGVGTFGQRFSQLQYDRNGIAHAIYSTGITSQSYSIRYAKFVSSGGNCGSDAWQCETVLYDSLSSASFGALGLTYYGSPRMAIGMFGGLFYVSRVGSNGNCSGIYRCDGIETNLYVASGDIYQPPCQVICTSPVQISYYDQTNGLLKLATSVENGGNCGIGSQLGKWQCDIIESVGIDNEIKVSLVMYNGRPYMTYTDHDDRANTTLKIAYPSQNGNCGPVQNGVGTWQCETVDNGFRMVGGFPFYHPVGKFPTIKINSGGTIYISYFDSAADDLLMAVAQLDAPPPPTGSNYSFIPAVFR